MKAERFARLFLLLEKNENIIYNTDFFKVICLEVALDCTDQMFY